MQWNLGIARELTSTLSLTIGYVGSRGVHLPYRMDNIDMVLPTLDSDRLRVSTDGDQHHAESEFWPHQFDPMASQFLL